MPFFTHMYDGIRYVHHPILWPSITRKQPFVYLCVWLFEGEQNGMAQSMHLHLHLHFCCEMQLSIMFVLCCVSVRLFCHKEIFIFAVTCRATVSGAGLFLYHIDKFISLFLELYLSRSRGNCIFICVVFRHLTAANKCCGTCFFNLQ